MITKNLELAAIQKKVRSSSNAMTKDSLWMSENEAKYLMGGRSTELIDRIMISYANGAFNYAHLYGVVAADQKNGRYVWIYLHYKNHLWKCYRIDQAFKLAERIAENEKLQVKLNRMSDKIAKQERLVAKQTALSQNDQILIQSIT